MSWNYSGDPSASALDQLRFLVGDTDANDPYLQDEEMQFLLELRGDPTRAASDACDAIMAKLAREVDYYIGPERVWASERYAQYKDLMQKRRKLWIDGNAAPTWSGSGVATQQKPLFSVGMFDNLKTDDGLTSE